MVGTLSLLVVDTLIPGEEFKHKPGCLPMVPPSFGTFSPLPEHLLVFSFLWLLRVCPPIGCDAS